MQKKILHGRRFYWPLRKTDSVYLPFKNMQQACILYFCPNNGSKQFQTLHIGPKGPPRQKFPGQWSQPETWVHCTNTSSHFSFFSCSCHFCVDPQNDSTLNLPTFYFFIFRTVWRRWAPTSILSASAVPTAARSSPTSLSTWRTACLTVRRVRPENWEMKIKYCI